MDNMDANALIVFHHVARTASLSKAAEELGLSRSALSHRIKAIELRLGCPLLVRTTRSLTLTEAGHRLAEYAASMAHTLQQANFLGQGLNRDAAGLLRISAPPGLGAMWLKPLIMAYMQANPGVQVDLRLSEQSVDMLRDAADLAIRVTARPPDNVVAKKLFAVSWHLCATPQLLARLPQVLTPRDGELSAVQLAALPLAGFSRLPRFRPPQLTRGAEQIVLQQEPVLVSNDLALVRDAVMASLGMAVLPDYCVRQDLAAGRLLCLLPDWQVAATNGDIAYALHLPGRLVPLRIRRLIDFLAAQLPAA